ncbi:MAG: hypothetical protein K1X50_09185, partial [Candidatus Promineofilum sp.]|nr:hypothetical protein [Promineifilum sp.]
PASGMKAHRSEDRVVDLLGLFRRKQAPQRRRKPAADAWRIDLSALPPGSYAVAVGVYNPADGLRLPAVAAGARLPDDVWLLGTSPR